MHLLKTVLMALIAMTLFGCRTAETTNDSSAKSIGIVNVEKGMKDVFYITGKNLHFWRCDLNGGLDEPEVKLLGVRGMNAQCKVHKKMLVVQFEANLTRAYLGKNKRLLMTKEKDALKFLLRIIRHRSEASISEKASWYDKRTERRLTGFGKFFINMHKALGVTPMALTADKVEGFKFSGKSSCDAIGIGFACPLFATAESDSCLKAGGKNLRCNDCSTLCSVPIQRPTKKQSGFNFGGKASCDVLGDLVACPAVISPVEDACFQADGTTMACDDCSVLCSKPIATQKDELRGFDFDGQRSCDRLDGGACTQQVNEAEEACFSVGGVPGRCNDCSVLCSKSITHLKKVNPVTGFGSSGSPKTCTPAPADIFCTAVFTSEDAFANKCESEGGEATACGCHDFVCSKNVNKPAVQVVEGFGMDGKAKACKPIPGNTICTAVFTLEDAFANDCRDQGGESTACGCHSHLCSINIKMGAVDGFGMDGEARSCKPASDGLICTQDFQPGDQFAFDCKDAGGTATKCGCHDNICSKNIIK